MNHILLVLALLLLVSSSTSAQDLALARAAARIDTEIDWMTDGFYAADPGRPVPTLPKTDVDRLKLLDQALQRAADEKKLVFWYIPRIEGGHMVRPEFLDTYMRVVAFTDEWLPKLINARFVPLRMAVDGPISKRTGITKLDWVEPAIVILDKDGKILDRLDRIRTFNADQLRRRFIGVAGRFHSEVSVPTGSSPLKTGFDVGRWALKTGVGPMMWPIMIELSRMEGEHDKAEGNLLLATVCRLAGDTEGVSFLMEADRLAADDIELKSSVLTERGLLALNAGDLTQAQAMLADAAGMECTSRRSEAMYFLGITQILNRDTALGEETFRKVVAEFGSKDDRYAARAAANLLRGRDTTPVGPAFHGYEDPRWPPERGFAESRPNTSYPRPVSEIDDTVKRAIAFLLKHQNDAGGFEDSRYAYCDSPRILPNVWVAITAIALAGLNDWREVDPKGIDEVIERGEGYLFDAQNMARGRNEECYADTFRLIYLARRLPTFAQGSEEATRARRRMNEISKRLADQQSETGYWAHEYKNPFASAAALLSLKQAQDGGAAVPSSVFETGVSAIKSLRGERGTFTYGAGRTPTEEFVGALKNSMARMPICERALLLTSKTSDTTALEAALDNFWKYLPRFERIRTCDYHSDGELGGFFFWHGMFLTSEAIKALPLEKRGPHERKMLEHVMSIGEMDGSFVDSHEVGKCYGTGMALMVLRSSAGRKP